MDPRTSMPASRPFGPVRCVVAAMLLLATWGRAQDKTFDSAPAVEDTLDPRTRQSVAWFAALERVNERIRASPISWLDGHLGVAARIRMSRDGERAVSWAEDGSAWLWNAWTGEPLGLLGMFGMGETSSRYGAQLHWPRFVFSADGERILLYEPLARFAGLWDGRSAEFLAHLDVADEKASAATFSPDGRRIAVASETGVVRFYDSERGLPLDTPVLESSAVDGIVFSPDGSYLLALTTTGRARMWDKTGALVCELGAAEDPIVLATFSDDASRILCVTRDRVVLVHSIESPSETRVLRAADGDWAHADLGMGGVIGRADVFSISVLPRGDRMLVVGSDGTVRLWNVEADREVALLHGIEILPKSEVWVGFSPGGARLLTIDARNGALLWDAATGARIADLETGAPAFNVEFGVFSPSGRLFATSSTNMDGAPAIARVYEVESGRLVEEIDEATLGDGSLFSMHFDDSDRLGIASAWGWGAVWGRSRSPLILSAHALQLVDEGLDSGLPRWSPAGATAFSATWGRTPSYADRLWDTRTGEVVREISGADLGGGGFLPSGELLAFRPLGTLTVSSVSPNRPAALAGIRPGDLLLRLGRSSITSIADMRSAIRIAPSNTSVTVLREGKETELALALAPDTVARSRTIPGLGLTVALGARMEFQDAKSGTVDRAVVLEPGIPGEVLLQVVFNRDGSRVLVRARKRAVLFDARSGNRLAGLSVHEPRQSTTYCALLHLVAMNPRGDVVAAVQPSAVRLWREASPEAPVDLPGTVFDLEFSPDGRMLAGAARDGSVLLWDVEERALARTLKGHRGQARFVAFDPSGWRLVTAGADDTARIWNLAGEGDAESIVLAGHAGLLNRPAFSPDGSRVITTGDDGTARLWDAANGAAIAVLEGHVGPVTHGEFSPDGTRILTQARDGSTRIWSGADGRLLATRIEYDDGWLMFEPSGHFMSGGMGAERAQMVVGGRRYPLSSYAAHYESPEKVAESLAGKVVRAPAFVPQAPELRVAAPLDPLVPERTFRLEVLIEDAYGIASVSLVQDGRELDAAWVARYLQKSGKTARLSCDLSLPSGANETTVKVRATNVRKILSAPRTVFARWEPPERELYVLALGVADYRDDSLDLKYPTQDVDDLCARLQTEQGGYYERVHTHRLVNEEVTPGNLRKAREEFLLRAKPDDTIVVFAAGHGVRSASGEYYFLTSSTTPASPYDGVERQALESLVTWDRLHARRRVLLLDTCHSGAAFGDDKRGVSADAFDQQTVNDAAGTGLYIIAASSEQGFAQEMGGNGLFTRCLINGLDGGADANRDGLVGIDELKTYVTAAVHEKSAGRQRPTAPRIEGGEDFPLARRRASASPPK